MSESGGRGLRVFVMGWIFLHGAIGTGLIGPVRLALEREFGLTHAAFGGYFALTQIVSTAALLGLVMPRVARQAIGPKLLACLVVSPLGLAVAALAPGWGWFLLGWVGIMAGRMLGAVANNISLDLWRDEPRRGVALLHGWSAVGKVTGPLAVAATVGAGWRAPYGLAIGVGALLLLAFLALRPRHTAYLATVPESDGGAGRVFRRRLYWFVLGSTSLIAGGEYAFASLAPTYFETVRGCTPAAASALLSVHLIGLAAGRFLVSGVSRRHSNNAVLAACLASGLAVIPAIWCPWPVVYVPALLVCGFMFSATWPVFYHQAASRLPEHRDMLAYGTVLGDSVGISVCIFVSSLLADWNLALALLFGPAVLGLWGMVYFPSSLARPAGAAAAPANGLPEDSPRHG